MGWVQPKASFEHAQRLIECIYKGGGHTRYELQYITLYHSMFMSASILYKDVYLGGLLFTSMSIYSLGDKAILYLIFNCIDGFVRVQNGKAEQPE